MLELHYPMIQFLIKSITFVHRQTSNLVQISGYSTEQAILEITDNLKLATDKGQITCGLFLDLPINNDIII